MSENMKITPVRITIRDLVSGFEDNAENGVRSYGGKLDIRPPYQREFVYNESQRAKVIDTVIKGFPLNTMYWAKRHDETFEIIDGQQRTLSICQYVTNEFSVNYKTFKSLQESEKNAILDYELTVYICEGDDKEKLEEEVAALMTDKDEVQNQSGIYYYVFDHDKKHLNLRQFLDYQKTIMYEKQGGICPMCKGTENKNKKWAFSEMDGDHIVPWSRGGKTVLENGQMLCRKHNLEKGDK